MSKVVIIWIVVVWSLMGFALVDIHNQILRGEYECPVDKEYSPFAGVLFAPALLLDGSNDDFIEAYCKELKVKHQVKDKDDV